MNKYVCPEGDFEQESPGMCPNHNTELMEKEMEEMSEMEEGEGKGEGWEKEEGGEEKKEEEM